MTVITGGNIISNAGHQLEGTRTRIYPNQGAPVAGTTYAGVIQVGEFVLDTTNNNLYEYTEPASVPTFTRIDTV